MSKKLLVTVVYGGEIERAFITEQGLRGMTGPITDLRFQPFVTTNEERDAGNHVSVKCDKWLMSERFRIKVDQRQLPGLNPSWNSIDVNAFLTVLSHFGFDAEYSMPWVRQVEPMISDVMLQAYRTDPEARRSDRLFHGTTYIRGAFFHAFDDLLVKYGM
jgi:hypothetical protein